jgi:hypothetical protein
LQKQLKIVFCLPGRTFSNNFLTSWSNLLQYLPKYGITPILSNSYSPLLYYVRNQCLGGASVRGKNQIPFDGQVDYDYIMWIDSDMVFEVNDFIKLLNMNKDIASGIYKTQNNSNYATVEKWNKEYYAKNGSFEFLDDKLINKRTKPFKVEYTGFGWVLIKKGVFESLEYPWFQPLWEEFKVGDTSFKEFTMEDVAFCRMITKKGYDIYVDPTLIIGHEKMLVLK